MTADRSPLADLGGFDEIIDVRSPAEFAEDHIPGAINCPVLDDAQRIEVGTLYKQVSPFEAKKIGAALVSENIGRHLRERFLDKARDWKPLIYCWRGGNRSGSMTTVFRAIGWKASQLDGGYKTWRSHVVAQLEQLPQPSTFMSSAAPPAAPRRASCRRSAACGEQILDLETLASHKGSVLGILPGQPQPSQKWFETLLLLDAGALRPGATGLCRGGKPQDRPPACARCPDRAHPRRRLLQHRSHAGGPRRFPAERLRLFPAGRRRPERTPRRCSRTCTAGKPWSAGTK